jgi:hypothetical protein
VRYWVTRCHAPAVTARSCLALRTVLTLNTLFVRVHVSACVRWWWTVCANVCGVVCGVVCACGVARCVCVRSRAPGVCGCVYACVCVLHVSCCVVRVRVFVCSGSCSQWSARCGSPPSPQVLHDRPDCAGAPLREALLMLPARAAVHSGSLPRSGRHHTLFLTLKTLFVRL